MYYTFPALKLANPSPAMRAALAAAEEWREAYDLLSGLIPERDAMRDADRSARALVESLAR